MAQEGVDEVRPGLEREQGLIGLEHQGEVDAVARFGQLQGQVVAAQSLGGLNVRIAVGELLVAFQQLADVFGGDGAGVGNLDNHAVLGEHLLNLAVSSRIRLKSFSKGLFSSTEMSQPGPSTRPSSAMTSSRSLYSPPTFALGLLMNRS